ncbi:hypothetical protein [Haloactinomyces albus]|uniref:Uncharacterized protein n=1 Tax=Haloactinomyces albus TaxID=1352928 RepID=A0AAE4CJJ9_9ACTN|nr:hypothetical protein [Haloactinomyces albus]MDR7300100.1 hypothetical protein [Haloactinomyces albus]
MSDLRRHARAARTLTDFDSSVNMVRALGRFLRGRDHRAMSVGPASPQLADALTHLPRSMRRRVFEAMGFLQAVPLDRIGRLDSDDLAQWVTRQYRGGPYPAVVIGAASGAAVHLAAALHAPFLPQTVLVGARDTATHPDDPVSAMRAVAPIAKHIAARNPDIAVHHMHDPAQDRPMLQSLAYLRLKRLRLGRIYERFLEERLAPGAPIILLDCTRDWRTTEVAERTYFQFGCLGGVSEEEYHDSGERVAEYLRREGSPRRRWQPPVPDARRPEAEWGFDSALVPDIARFAHGFGHPMHRLTVADPQDLSPFVADLYRWWYRRRGLPADRLLAESYVQFDPLWTLRLAAVPFWLRFNMLPSYAALRDYLHSAEPFRDIHVNLFSQGLRSPGVVPVDRWRELAAGQAGGTGEMLGVDESTYPLDVGSSMRYTPAFAALPPRHPIPPPLSLADIDEFRTQTRKNHAVDWTGPVR